MQRGMNQTLAWLLAVVLAGIVFGIGGFWVMKKKPHGQDTHEMAAKPHDAKDDHGAKDHHDATKSAHAPKDEHGKATSDHPAPADHGTPDEHGEVLRPEH